MMPDGNHTVTSLSSDCICQKSSVQLKSESIPINIFFRVFFLVQSLNMNFSLEKGFEIFPAEHILFNPLLACILFGIIYHLMT